jgi:hypothetical protein
VEPLVLLDDRARRRFASSRARRWDLTTDLGVGVVRMRVPAPGLDATAAVAFTKPGAPRPSMIMV